MSENLLLGIIATVVTVLLLAMPFILFKKKKEQKAKSKLKPRLQLLPHDDTEIVSTEDAVSIVRTMLDYLLAEDLINTEDRHMVEANMQKWKPGVKFRDLIDAYFSDLQKSTSIKWPLFYNVVMEGLSSVHEFSQMKDLEHQVVINTAICRICYNRLLHNLKEVEF